MQWQYLQAEHFTYHVKYCVTKLLSIQLNKIVHPTAYMEIEVDPGNNKLGWQKKNWTDLIDFDINSVDV